MKPEKYRGILKWEKGFYHRVPDFLENWSRPIFVRVAVIGGVLVFAVGWLWWPLWLLLGLPWALFTWRGVADMNQEHHAILKNYPVLGHMRYVLESFRPEIQQYFVETDSSGRPFDREDRSVVYQRAKSAVDTLPFGTRDDLYAEGAEWIQHSLYPHHLDPEEHRVLIGEGRCEQPYSASLLNVSAMSYGSLSRNAVMALNLAAKAGGFSHNTGEGGLAPHHLQGGDLVWQIGTGYFGCRSPEGGFDPEMFAERARRPEVKMIEVKLSQGAKPAHGGILPAAKVTAEVSEIRGVPMGQDVISPPAHTAFSGPYGLLEFVTRLRELSGGKPVGFKLCIGNPVEFLTLCHAMRDSGLRPDFITVDGAEGGTGAAPLEFSNRMGMPLVEGLAFAHDALVGADLRDDLKIISAGKIATGFHIVRQLALGADVCNSARAMMFALGCIQALKCNTNHCPTGIATQDEALQRGLHVPTKMQRVRSFQAKTVESAFDLMGAAGLSSPTELRRYHVMRRCSPTQVLDLERIYPSCTTLDLVSGTGPMHLQQLWEKARIEADRWQARVEA